MALNSIVEGERLRGGAFFPWLGEATKTTDRNLSKKILRKVKKSVYKPKKP